MSSEATTLATQLANTKLKTQRRWWNIERSLRVVSVLSVLGLWWLASYLAWVPDLLLPNPSAVFNKLLSVSQEGFADATLWVHLSASLQRVLLATIAAVLTAIPLGLALGLNRIVCALIDPLIELYRPVPPLAYLPLIIIWFGIGEFSKVLLIYLAIFAPLVLSTAAGVRRIAPDRVHAAQALGANRVQLVVWVILPNTLPDILTGLRIGLGAGWSTLVAAELVAATQGLGFMVQSAAQFLVTDVVILGILVIALVALLLDSALRLVQHWLTPWQGRI